MKKIIIVLTVLLANTTSQAFQGSQLIQNDNLHEYKENRFLDAAAKPYDEYETNQHDIDEYDQNISDNVQPPKISKIEAIGREVAIFVLMRLLAAKDIACVYYKELKDTLNKWFNSVVNF